MDKRGFFIGLITGILRGALSPEAAAELLVGALQDEALRAGDAELFKHCEDFLAHAHPADDLRADRELSYLLECLQGERSFEANHPFCMRKSPLRVRVRLGFGVIAWVQPVGEYRAVGLGTTQPALVADLRKLESDEAFQDLLTWHSARMTRLADQSCYLLRPSGLPRFFRELRHFFNLHFPGV